MIARGMMFKLSDEIVAVAVNEIRIKQTSEWNCLVVKDGTRFHPAAGRDLLYRVGTFIRCSAEELAEYERVEL